MTIITRPYLIQTMRLKKETTGSTLDGMLGMDYMGSAEFEFGALPTSLKRITRNINKFKAVRTGILNHKGDAVYLITMLKDEYEAHIKNLSMDDVNLKERSRLPEMISGKDFMGRDIDNYSKVDAWWDLENDVMFCFTEELANKIITALIATRDKKMSENNKEWF